MNSIKNHLDELTVYLYVYKLVLIPALEQVKVQVHSKVTEHSFTCAFALTSIGFYAG